MKDPNQGEGDKASAKRYNREVRDFIAEGKVDEAARGAARFVEAEPAEAKRDERRAKYGPKPTRLSVDELVASAKTVIDRVRPYLERLTSRIRNR